MRQPLLRYWLGPLCMHLIAGCSSATDEYRPITSTPDDYCQRRCEKAHTCTDSINVAECRSSCLSTLATGPKLREDLLGYVGGCAETSDCTSSITSKCKSEALAQLSMSKYGQSFCAAYLEAGKKCDGTGSSYSESACFGAAKSYDDSALKAANDCLAKSCTELGSCLAQAIPEAALSP